MGLRFRSTIFLNHYLKYTQIHTLGKHHHPKTCLATATIAQSATGVTGQFHTWNTSKVDDLISKPNRFAPLAEFPEKYHHTITPAVWGLGDGGHGVVPGGERKNSKKYKNTIS